MFRPLTASTLHAVLTAALLVAFLWCWSSPAGVAPGPAAVQSAAAFPLNTAAGAVAVPSRILGALKIGEPLAPAADPSQWQPFADPLARVDPRPRSTAAALLLASPACQYDPTSPLASITAMMHDCYPGLEVEHVMHGNDGSGCGVPSQIGGRCYCPTELGVDECRFVKDGVKMDMACRLLYMVSAFTKGPVVEFGTWCGHSTRCLAAGAAASGIPGRVHGCDFFQMGPDYVKLKWTTYWRNTLNANSDLLPIFRELTTPFDPTITYHKGNCHQVVPGSWAGGGQLSVFTTDASKGDDVFLADFQRVWRSLDTGTILVLADFVYSGSTNPDFVYARLVSNGFVAPFFFAGYVSHTAFVVLKPFTEEIVRAFDRKSVTKAEWTKYYDMYLADYNRIASSLGLPEVAMEFQRDIINTQRNNALRSAKA